MRQRIKDVCEMGTFGLQLCGLGVRLTVLTALVGKHRAVRLTYGEGF